MGVSTFHPQPTYGGIPMPLKLTAATSITFLDSLFVQLINDILDKSPGDVSNGVILNFRDPTYSAENGGFHPVELAVSPKGDLLYLTDFSFAGMPPFVELGIELDWNFERDSFRQFDSFYGLECGRGLLGLYTKNFAAYYEGGCFEVEVTPL
jgi:hypothetical protein